ncbi:MDR family MFS transporter [Pseudobacillus wudalianchiensis]|uniref:MFS transporter n=1 Tax=Pseudobacillus wudalianchiensis TaxID=1743143 RepID=A0A1B9AG51_9BACI|nr:MFS transporter [Bacillus wudalianchiensis]OCA82809.1 MFS transporter [Bacillus wudalianchiensis]
MKIREWDHSLKVRLIGESIMNITFWMFFPFLAIYFAEEFGKGKAGLLLILSQVFSVIANLIGGYCADRFGRKRMMVLSSFGQGLSFLLFAFANSPWYESALIGFFAFTVASVFGALYWPASQAMVADVVEEKDRSDVFAVFYTSINIAVVIGPILGGIFFFTYRFELMLFAAFTCFLLSFILFKWTDETVPENASLTNLASKNWIGVIVEQIKDYHIIVKDKIFMIFIIAGILSSQTFMQLDLLIPVYTKEAIDVQTIFSLGDWIVSINGEKAFGILVSENGFLVALFTVLVSKWVTRFHEKNVFAISSILYAVSMWMFGLTDWFWGFVLAMIVFTLGELLIVGLQQSFISVLAPEHMRGQYFAAASLRYTVGRMIAPVAIPLTIWIGYFWTFSVIAILSLASAAFYYYMFILYRQQKDNTPAQ